MSFIAGMCGYIIVRFWILPIVRYRRVKWQLLAGLQAFSESLPADGAVKLKAAPAKMQLRELRRKGSQLISLHDGCLPYWYRLMLLTRKESPAKAAVPILRLENMPTAGQARQCIDTIGRHLRDSRWK
ncbi:MAG: hypothetical protein C4519_16175 [Desulfobacteraceae bacterium]|nr:MAG: hypothetical protein C4519_16175 [Desulfobacteraceae bacterium]